MYQIGLNKTLGLLGMDYRDPCYNCLAPSLSLVFVIDLTGPVYNVMQAKKYSVAMVNQALTSSAPFNYVLSAYSHTGLFQFSNLILVIIKSNSRILKHFILHTSDGSWIYFEQDTCSDAESDLYT